MIFRGEHWRQSQTRLVEHRHIVYAVIMAWLIRVLIVEIICLVFSQILLLIRSYRSWSKLVRRTYHQTLDTILGVEVYRLFLIFMIISTGHNLLTSETKIRKLMRHLLLCLNLLRLLFVNWEILSLCFFRVLGRWWMLVRKRWCVVYLWYNGLIL